MAPANNTHSPQGEGDKSAHYYSMGEKYELGDGVARNFQQAKIWYKRAASAGNVAARAKLELPWFVEDLIPIKSAPSLFTINGIGFKLYGKSDFDDQTNTFFTTHYLTFLYIPLLPIARYLVISDDDHSYAFLGKSKFRNIEWIHVGVFVILFIWMLTQAR